MKKGLFAIIMIPLMLCRPLAVNAGVPETEAVEAMQKVWQFEKGQLTEEANEDLLAAAVEKIEAVKDYEVFKDLHKMRHVATGELAAKRAREEAERIAAEETRKAEERKAAASFYGTCKITHYCGCNICCGSWGNATASGAMPQTNHTVANGNLPFGTRVLINGQEYVVEDRGVDGSTFDIYCASHSEALNRGLYYAEVYIVG